MSQQHGYGAGTETESAIDRSNRSCMEATTKNRRFGSGDSSLSQCMAMGGAAEGSNHHAATIVASSRHPYFQQPCNRESETQSRSNKPHKAVRTH